MHVEINGVINAVLGVGIVTVGSLLVWSFKRNSQHSEDIAVLKATTATKETVSGLEEKSRGHGYEIAEMKKIVGVVSEMKGELGQVKERVELIYNHIIKGQVT